MASPAAFFWDIADALIRCHPLHMHATQYAVRCAPCYHDRPPSGWSSGDSGRLPTNVSPLAQEQRPPPPPVFDDGHHQSRLFLRLAVAAQQTPCLLLVLVRVVRRVYSEHASSFVLRRILSRQHLQHRACKPPRALPPDPSSPLGAPTHPLNHSALHLARLHIRTCTTTKRRRHTHPPSPPLCVLEKKN